MTEYAANVQHAQSSGMRSSKGRASELVSGCTPVGGDSPGGAHLSTSVYGESSTCIGMGMRVRSCQAYVCVYEALHAKSIEFGVMHASQDATESLDVIYTCIWSHTYKQPRWMLLDVRVHRCADVSCPVHFDGDTCKGLFRNNLKHKHVHAISPWSQKDAWLAMC